MFSVPLSSPRPPQAPWLPKAQEPSTPGLYQCPLSVQNHRNCHLSSRYNTGTGALLQCNGALPRAGRTWLSPESVGWHLTVSHLSSPESHCAREGSETMVTRTGLPHGQPTTRTAQPHSGSRTPGGLTTPPGTTWPSSMARSVPFHLLLSLPGSFLTLADEDGVTSYRNALQDVPLGYGHFLGRRFWDREGTRDSGWQDKGWESVLRLKLLWTCLQPGGSHGRLSGKPELPKPFTPIHASAATCEEVGQRPPFQT